MNSTELKRKVESQDLVALREYLWERCDIQDNGCWDWAKHFDRYGYPKTGKGAYSVHRLIYRGFHGEIPAGYHVHHTCGNSKCLNPRHLSSDPARSNSAEMLERRAYQARIQALESALVEAGVPLP